MLKGLTRDGQEFYISEEDKDLLKYTWRINADGYIVRSGWSKDGTHRRTDTHTILKGKGKIFRLHRIIAARMGIMGMVDHINRNRVDATRENLREASFELNAFNTSRKVPKSGYRGICWVETSKRYLVRCCNRQKPVKSLEEAIAMRKIWEEEQWKILTK